MVKTFQWNNKRTSDHILGILIIAWVVVSFVPIRVFVVLGLLKKWNVESRFYKRRYINNYECSRIAIRNFFRNKNVYSFTTLFKEESWHKDEWPLTKFKPEDLMFEL